MDFVARALALFKSPFKYYRLKGRLLGHTAAITRLAILQDGSHLASGSSDETIKIWDLTTMTLMQVLRDKHHRWGQVTALKWFTDRDTAFLLAGTARGRIAVYSLMDANNTLLPIINEAIFPENTPIEDLDFHSSTHSLTLSSALGEVRCYRFQNKGIPLDDSPSALAHVNACVEALSKDPWIYRFKDHTGLSPTPRSLHFHSANELFVYLLESGRLICFDADLGVKKWEKNFDTPIGHVSISPDKKRALVDNMSGGFDLYDVADTLSKRSFGIPGKHNHVKDATFVEMGSSVACPCEDGVVYIFNTMAAKPQQILRHNRGGLWRVVAHGSSTRYTIVSASNTRGYDLCVWEKLIEDQSKTHVTPRTKLSVQQILSLNLLTFFLALWGTFDKWYPAITSLQEALCSVSFAALLSRHPSAVNAGLRGGLPSEAEGHRAQRPAPEGSHSDRPNELELNQPDTVVIETPRPYAPLRRQRVDYVDKSLLIVAQTLDSLD